MIYKGFKWGDTSVTDVSPHASPGHLETEERLVKALIPLIRRNIWLSSIRDQVMPGRRTRDTRRAILLVARGETFGRVLAHSYSEPLQPRVRSAWEAWRMERGTDRDRMRSLRRLFREVSRLCVGYVQSNGLVNEDGQNTTTKWHNDC